MLEAPTLQNVRAEIKALEVGGEARFPKFRYEYVLSCRTKLQTALSRVFSSEIQGEEVVIVRTA